MKETKSWILVTLDIKLWKCQTVLGCLGPKGPPSVGIGLMKQKLDKPVKVNEEKAINLKLAEP